MKKANVRGKTIAILVSAMLALLMAGLLCLTPVRQTRARAAATVSDAAGLITAYETASANDTITLRCDIEIDMTQSAEWMEAALPNGHLEMTKSITIDLGEHTLTVKTGNASGTAQGVAPCCINIGQGSAAAITIKNGTLTGESYGSFAYVQSGSSLALEDVTVNFTHNTGAETVYSAALVSAGTVKMDGVTFGTLINSYPMESSGTVTGGVQDLINASSASEPATITLTEDLTQNLVVPAYASVTLDLGGYTLSPISEGSTTITNHGTLTVVNTATTTSSVEGLIPFGGDGVLTVSGGKYLVPLPDSVLSDGLALSKTANDSYYWLSNSAVLAKIEKEEETYSYTSLPGAVIGAVEGDTVKLVSNVTLNGQSIDKAITLDLGTYTITNNSSGPAFTLTASGIKITGSEGAKLVSKNMTFYAKGSSGAQLENITIENIAISTDSNSTLNQSILVDYADLTLSGVTVTAPKTAVLAQNGSDLKIEKSSVTSPYIGVWVKGEGTTATISDKSTIICNGQAAAYYSVYSNDKANVSISDSTLLSDYICLEVNLGSSATVSGSTLTVTYASMDPRYAGAGVGLGTGPANTVSLENCEIDATVTNGVGISVYGSYTEGNSAVSAGTETYSALTISGGEIKSDSYALVGNGTRHGTTINIENCNLTSNNATGIYHPQYGNLTITGNSTIKGVTGIEMRAGNLTISQDTVSVEATSEEFATEAVGDGMTVVGAAVAVVQHTTKLPIRVNMNDGKYTTAAEDGMAVYEADLQNNGEEALEKVSITIKGGTFNGAVESQNVANFIEGGTFTEPVNKDYLAEGRMQLQQSADGTFTIVENEDAAVTAGAVAVVASTNAAYTDLQDAIDAAASDDTITLLKDIDVSTYMEKNGNNIGIYINKSLTIDGNGHELNNTSSSVTRFVWVLNESATSTSADDNNDGNNIVVTFNNVNIVNNAVAAARAVETRSGDITLKFVGCTIDTSGSSGNTQGVTVGGSGADINLTFDKTTITPGVSGYSLITFNPAVIEITNGSSFSGFASLYFKGIDGSLGSNGTTVAVNGSTLTSGGQEGGTNEFGTIVFEAGGITVDITNSTLSAATEATNTDQAIVMFSGYQDDTEASTVTITGTKIEADGNCVVFYKPNAVAENTALIGEGSTINIPVETKFLASGYSLLAGEDGYTAVEESTAISGGSAVAGIESDGTYILYATLQDAIDAAASGDTITLLNDVTENVTVAKDQTLTLDLNGKKILNNGTAHTLANYGVLTVKDTAEDGTVDNTASGRAAFINYGTATLSGGTFTRSVDKPGTTWYTIKNYGHLTINEGTTVSTLGTSTSSMIANGYQSASDKSNNVGSINTNDKVPTLTITGGTFDSNYITIKNDEEGVLAISGGTFDKNGATTDQSVQNWSQATITGGEFNKPVISWEQGSIVGELTVEGGIFHDEVYAIELNASGDAGYIGEDGVVIEGGTFDELVDKNYLAENVSLYTDEKGNYEVAKTAPEGMQAVGVVVNGVGYANVASALHAVSGELTITLYTDLEEAVAIPEGRTVTLDLAGYTLTAPSDARHTVYNEGKLTIVSTGEKGTIIGSTSAIFNGTNGEGESTPGALYGAVLSLDNVKLEATNTAAAVTLNNNYATIESITDCEIVTAAGTTAIANSGYIKSISGTTINAPEGSGLFGGAGTAIRLSGDKDIANSGTIDELSGCTITGNIATTSAEAVGQLKITGGSFTGEANFATGSSLYFYNANGTIYVGLQDYVVSAGAVAAIGHEAYGSLGAAIAAAATIDTITLIDDITVNSMIEIRTTKKLKFDLGEKTITGGNIENIFKITTTTVTFNNGTIEAKNTAFELIGSSLMASATVTFGDDLAITSQNDSAVYIYGGYKLNTTADITAKLAAIMGNGSVNGFTTINVNGGSLTSTDSVAMYLPQKNGTTTISGGTITGKTGIEIRNGTLNIKGGTIIATGETLVTEPNGSGSTVNAGAAVAISKYTGNNKLKVTIEGGELKGLYAIYEANLNPNEAEIDVTKITPSVTGGTFKGEVYSENLTGFISGGTYDGAVDAEYLADGFVQTEANGLYTVVKGEAVVGEGAAAVNADTLIAYDSLQDAIEEAGNGETITLLNDVTATETIVVAEGKSVILELGEKTLSAADGVETTLSNEGTLTINGGTISGSTAIANSGYITSITDTVINAGSGTAILLAGDAETMNSGTIAELRGCTVAGDIATATAEAVGRLKLINTTFRGEMNFAEGSGLYYYTAADATYVGLQSYVVSAGAVAAIGHEAYGGLQTAIDEADSDTVVLLTSIAVNETITVSEGFAVTLDLGGMTVTGGDVENVFLIDGVHFSAFNGSVTAENTAFKIVGNTGDFGRSITFGDTLYMSSSNGTAVTVENSVILDTYASISAKLHAIAAAGETGSVQIKVNGGRLSSAEDAALYLGSSGSVTAVNAGTIVGKTGIELVSGTLNVTGGIIAAADETGYALYEAAEEGAETALSITGGTFEGKVYSESLTGFVTGGRFDELIEEAYLGEGVSIFSGERGYYIVDESAPEGMEAVRVIADGRTYESVAAALEATAGSVTITLYTDITEGVVIPEGRTVTLDLNGYTLTAPEGAAALTNSGTLTVEGGSIAGDITTAEGSVGQFKLVDITLNGEAVFAEDSGMYTYAAEDATYFGPRDYVVGVGAAASIGTAAYASLADAMEAAEDGATIVLIADLAAEETIAIDRDNVTIDLGGMTVTGGAEKLFLVSAVNVTFVNGTVEAEAIAFEIAGNASASEGAVTFGEGLFVTSEDTAVLVSGTGALIVTGGTITGNTAIEVRGGTLTVTGGTLTAEDAGYALYEAAEEGTAVAMAIEGGTVEGKVYSENLAGYITGGKFTVEPSEEACGEDCETRFEDGFYIVIDVAALNDAREAAQAEVMGYAEEKGMSWEYIVEIAAEESDSALKAEAQAVLAAYEAIAESEDEPAVGEAKTAALGAVDALIAAFDVLKDDAAAQIDGAASEAGITAPEALYTAVESAATEEALAESLAAALEEIAAIEEQIALIGTQEQQLEGIAGAMQALGEALNGTAEGSEALESVREAVQRAEAAVAGGTNGEMSAETLESEYDALAAAIDGALDALAVEAEGAGADADGLRDSLEALGADNAELDALITAAVSAAEDVQAADAAEVQAAAEELAAAVEALTAQLVVENGAVAAINGGMERAVEALTGGQFAGAAEALEAAVIGTENAVFTALAEDIAAAETAIGSAVGQLAGESGSLASFADAFQAIAESIASLGEDAGALEEAVEAVEASIAAAESAEGGLDRLSAAVEGAAGADAVVEAAQTIFEGWTAEGGRIGGLEARLTAAKQAVGELSEEAQETIGASVTAAETALAELRESITSLTGAEDAAAAAEGILQDIAALQTSIEDIESDVRAAEEDSGSNLTWLYIVIAVVAAAAVAAVVIVLVRRKKTQAAETISEAPEDDTKQNKD